MDAIRAHRLNVFSNAEALFVYLAVYFMELAYKEIDKKGEFSVVLPGGNTPKLFFEILVNAQNDTAQFPWKKIKCFFSDERYVPVDSADNNYRMAYDYLFSKLGIPDENIYRIHTEFKNPKDAAKDYELTLRTVFHIHDHEFPKFDLVLLGLGADTHTASLMPLSEVVKHYCESREKENYQLVDSLWVPEQNMHRITLTPQAINHAASVLFMVTGSNKATAVYNAIKGPYAPEYYPAQLIKCVNSTNMWYIDEAASSKLEITVDKLI